MNKIINIGVPFILGIGAGWIVQGRHWDIFLTSYIPALVTLLAAFYGAKFAFQFQKDKEKEDNKNRDVINGNRAIFSLMRMTSTLKNVQRQIIDPVRDSLSRFVEMRPILNMIKDEIKLSIGILYFLLEIEDRNLLIELVTEEARYQNALDAINERSLIHRKEVQPLLERGGIVQGGDYSLLQIENLLGNRLYITVQQATEQVIDHIDSTIISLQKVANKLTASLNKHYSNDAIIGFKISA